MFSEKGKPLSTRAKEYPKIKDTKKKYLQERGIDICGKCMQEIREVMLRLFWKMDIERHSTCLVETELNGPWYLERGWARWFVKLLNLLGKIFNLSKYAEQNEYVLVFKGKDSM